MAGPNPRIFADTFYVGGVPIPSSYFQTVDTNQAAALNGDAGGSYTPTSPIAVNGAGFWACGPWGFSSGAIKSPSGSGKRFILGDGDHFVLKAGHSGASRNITVSGDLAVDVSGGPSKMLMNAATLGRRNWAVSALGSPASGGHLLYPLTVHDGATLTSVVFTFVVTATHVGVPAQLPAFRLYAVTPAGVVTVLSTIAAGNSSGFVVFNPTPANAAAWNNGAAAQTFTVNVDGGGTVVDTSQFLYFADVADEAGTNALYGNEYLTAKPTFTSIPDQRWQ